MTGPSTDAVFQRGVEPIRVGGSRNGLVHRKRRILINGGQAVAGAALALAAVAGASSGAAAAGPRRAPAVDQSATPRGWTAVDFNNAQVSIPDSWVVLTGGIESCGAATGVLILGQGRWCPVGIGGPAAPGTSIVTLTSMKSPAGTSGAPTRVINGLSVYAPDISPVYLIPALKAELTFSGPMQPGVLHSITYSPRAVALASTSSAVPSGWRSVSFKGVRFSVPSPWSVRRTRHAPACSSFDVLPRPGVTLALEPELAIPCPAPPLTVKPAVAGVEVEAFSSGDGPGISNARSCVLQKRERDLRACVDAGPSYGELVVQLSVARVGPVTVRIGLSGDGLTGRTILSSLRRS